jgi:hypothetical protein
MSLVNAILSRCIVEEEGKCEPFANLLLDQVKHAFRISRLGGQILDKPFRPCRVCGQGYYEQDSEKRQISFAGNPLSVAVHVCNLCGHVQIFRSTQG